MEEKIINAVTPIVEVCVSTLYDGDAAEYCEISAEEVPTAHGDDVPHAIRYLVQLHYYFPAVGHNPNARKKALRRALGELGGTYPTVTNASDEVSGHLVFEFELVEGDL